MHYFIFKQQLSYSEQPQQQKKSVSVITKPQLLESIVPMSGQKLYTFPIHPMMFSWSPAAADSSAGVAHQGQCQREFGILLCSFIIQQCCVPVFGKRLSLTEQEHTYSMVALH